MKCPKCGYERQSRDDAFVPVTECPACGIVYSKHEHVTASDGTPAAGPPSHLKASPVDPNSLKKARERVDKRIRDRLGSQVRDQRHAQTLKLAKRLTTEQVRKRREERELMQGHAQLEDPTLAAAQPLDLPLEIRLAEKDNQPRPQTETDTQRQNSDMEPDDPAAQAAAADAVAFQPETGRAVSEATAQTQSAQTEASAEDDAGPVSTEAKHADEEPVLLEETVPVSTDNPGAAMATDAAITEQTAPEPQQDTVPEHEPVYPAANAAAMAGPPPAANGLGSGLARFFPIVAWLILAAGGIGAVLSWTTISAVEAGASIPIPDGLNALPLGLLLGFAYLATGVLGFAFFWVSSLISTQLKDIRILLMHHPLAMHSEED